MGRKKKAEAGLIHYPLWVCERNVVVKEKTPFHTWMRQCRKSGNKKCGFSIRVNAMITEFFMFLYHQADYLQIKNLANLWQTRMGKAMIPLNTHIAICLNIEIRR